MRSKCYSGKLTFWPEFFFQHIWDVKTLGQCFLLPSNYLAPVCTPASLSRQHGLDTFWKLFLYIAVRRITGYMCYRLNQQEKKMKLKKRIVY